MVGGSQVFGEPLFKKEHKIQNLGKSEYLIRMRKRIITNFKFRIITQHYSGINSIK